MADARQALESFTGAYAAFRAQSDAGLERVGQLIPFGLGSPERFEYSNLDSGATVTVSDLHEVYRCAAVLDPMDTEPECAADFTRAGRSLRAAWDSANGEG